MAPRALESSEPSLTPKASPPAAQIRLIGAAPFALVAKQPGVELFSATMRDIEKALAPKVRTDPAIVLPPEYHEFLSVFSQNEADKLPPHRPSDHRIELQPGKEPGYSPFYNMSQDELKVLKKFLDENLTKGFIRPSSSPAASPVLFARKPSGGLRLCVDYRALNAITVKNRYPLPLIQETLARICRAKIYSKLDIIAAFNKIRMALGEEWKTAFRTRYGLYESLVMPFGLANAPSTFQQYINSVLYEYLDDFCTAYINDILIYSNSKAEHKEHVRKVLKRLRDAGLQVDIDKYAFSVTEVKYLGLIITTKGIRMDPEKLSAVLEWLPPKNIKDVQSFLGFANFYRRFIQGFSAIAGPLTQLTKKDHAFNWTPKYQAAFDGLKEAFTSAPILLHFDPEKEIVVETDVSDYVTTRVMSQYDDKGQLRSVVYFSTKMLPAECNYEIYNKELLAIIRAFEVWRLELEGTEKLMTVLSDHKNLEYFITTKLLSRRQACWSEFLSRSNFKITYHPGGLNKRADALTRQSRDLPKRERDRRREYQWQTVLKPENLDVPLFQASLTPVSIEEPVLEVLKTPRINPEPKEELEASNLEQAIDAAYVESEWAQKILTALGSGAQKMKGFPLAKCEAREGRIYFRNRLFISNNDLLRLRLIQESHVTPSTGHPGRAKTYELLTRYYYWLGLPADVKRFARNCRPCSRAKVSRERYHGALKPLAVPDRRWSYISMDFVITLPESEDYFN